MGPEEVDSGEAKRAGRGHWGKACTGRRPGWPEQRGRRGEPWEVLLMTEWTVAILPSDQRWGQPWGGGTLSWLQPHTALTCTQGAEAFPVGWGQCRVDGSHGHPGFSVSLSIPPSAWGPCGLGATMVLAAAPRFSGQGPAGRRRCLTPVHPLVCRVSSWLPWPP